MNLPVALPDWLPWWAAVLLLIPVLIYLAALLLMPFSVFGVKGRLELIDARLDEIQGEIRALSLRLPESGRPPIPPARIEADWPDEDLPPDEPPPRRPPVAERPERPARAEPRLDWPR